VKAQESFWSAAPSPRTAPWAVNTTNTNSRLWHAPYPQKHKLAISVTTSTHIAKKEIAANSLPPTHSAVHYVGVWASICFYCCQESVGSEQTLEEKLVHSYCLFQLLRTRALHRAFPYELFKAICIASGKSWGGGRFGGRLLSSSRSTSYGLLRPAASYFREHFVILFRRRWSAERERGRRRRLTSGSIAWHGRTATRSNFVV